MTTNYNYTSNEILNRNYSYFPPNNTGRITNRSKYGPYNIIEKDFGDHKVFDYIPSSYKYDYDISQLDEQPFHQEQQNYYSPVVSKRQYYQSYDNDDDYIEELPIISPRRNMNVSPRRPQVIKRIYYELLSPPPPPSPKITEYIYEDDYTPKNEEITEYIVRDRPRKERYIEEFHPIHHTTYVENLPLISRSSRALPSPPSIKPLYFQELSSPRRSQLKQQQTRRTTPIRLISQNNNNEQNYISLKDVLAENRARRGTHIPKPRREIDEEEFYDPPIYNKKFVKNNFLVHK